MTPKHTFFAPTIPPDGAVPLPPEEASHATRVLRLSQGDQILLVDGKGSRSHAVLETVTKRGVIARTTDTVLERPALPVRLHVAAALLKNTGRFETMLEKVAEIGASTVVPLISTRTEQRRLRSERASKILASAMKQSGSAWLTELGEVTKFTQIIQRTESARFICHESAPETQLLSTALAHADLSEGVLLAIGPEGGFTDTEVADAVSAGFQVVSLGRARLRAETASIVAAATIAQYAERHD